MSAQRLTSVNGLDRRNHTTLSKAIPGQSAKSPRRSDPNATSANPTGEVQPSRQASTRNDSVLCTEPAIKLSSDPARPKRLMADTVEQSHRDSGASAGALSPKRRMLDSRNEIRSHAFDGATLDLLNTHVSVEPINSERSSRERSPIPTRNQRVAPPRVRPEIEAHLAESLATHLQDANKQWPAANDSHDVPVTTRYNGSPPEVYILGDPGGPHNKRRRCFSRRTKTGCYTCRRRKKKCDEAKPECNNCTLRGFPCTGYGPKPIGHKGPNVNGRAQVPLQPKGQDVSQQSPAPLSSGSPRYDHWGRIPPTPTNQEPQHRFPTTHSSQEARRTPSHDVWRSSPWQRESHGSYPFNTLPPVDYNQAKPFATNCGPRLPPHEAWRHPMRFPCHPLPGPAATISSRESVGSHSSWNLPSAYLATSEISAQQPMNESLILAPIAQTRILDRSETLVQHRGMHFADTSTPYVEFEGSRVQENRGSTITSNAIYQKNRDKPGLLIHGKIVQKLQRLRGEGKTLEERIETEPKAVPDITVLISCADAPTSKEVELVRLAEQAQKEAEVDRSKLRDALRQESEALPVESSPTGPTVTVAHMGRHPRESNTHLSENAHKPKPLRVLEERSASAQALVLPTGSNLANGEIERNGAQ